jgi:ceramide glucosyltransferase
MCSEIILAVWSAAALIWWILAWRLVAADHTRHNATDAPVTPRSLSIFKPLPLLSANGIDPLEAGLESFVTQLDSTSELLLGIHETDRSATASFVDRLRTQNPAAQLKIIFRSEPDDVANPKIAWQKILARHAEGELWLWSDADIVAPAQFLEAMRRDYERSDAAMVTYPYVIRELPAPPALLEALFVNVEFFPGVLLLRRFGAVDFGLGAAMLFQRDDFHQRIEWREIGAVLADDFLLGQRLQPVRIGTGCLTTLAASSTWNEALRHDMRWTKTIRWNRPTGSFARVLVLPVLGWICYTSSHSNQLFAWVGLIGMMQLDVLFAAAICRAVGCRLSPAQVARLELWSLWRVIIWLWCWLPMAVFWRGEKWRGPREIQLEPASVTRT